VFVPGDMSWDTFYLIISRSTTPDVVKMLAKLEEFFSLQLRNSVRAFATLGQSIHSDVMLRRHPAVTQGWEVTQVICDASADDLIALIVCFYVWR